MKTKHPIRLTALALGLALLTFGCAPAAQEEMPAASPQTSGDYDPVTITNYNYAGDEVSYTYEKAPERVVAVYQGSIETMIALGLEDRVIASYGLDNEVKEEWQSGFSRMNYKDDVFAPDKETMTLLEPDMILSWGSLFSEKAGRREQLEPEGGSYLYQFQHAGRRTSPDAGKRVYGYTESGPHF